MARNSPERESPSELRARALIESVLHCTLERIVPSDLPNVCTADYRTLEAPCRSVEVKEITPQANRDLTAAFAKAKSFDSRVLTGRWTVLIEAPSLSETLRPMPNFPPDRVDSVSAHMTDDSRVVPRAEREVEHRQQHPGPKLPTVRLKNLGRDLERSLQVLEANGVECTRGARRSTSDVGGALSQIAVRTDGSICMWHRPGSYETPGVDIALSMGSTRTEHPDTIVGRIQLWLDSEDSQNLRDSLAAEAGAEGHAVLVFDPNTEPEYQAAVAQGTAFVPTVALDLPLEIDMLWSVLGPVACSYSLNAGWHSFGMPDW
jgi:hypothetical protein